MRSCVNHTLGWNDHSYEIFLSPWGGWILLQLLFLGSWKSLSPRWIETVAMKKSPRIIRIWVLKEVEDMAKKEIHSQQCMNSNLRRNPQSRRLLLSKSTKKTFNSTKRRITMWNKILEFKRNYFHRNNNYFQKKRPNGIWPNILLS